MSALVLAGSRRGEGDPVARYRQVAHKCLATAGGVPMLVRVVRALRGSPRIGRILVSVDDADLLDRLPDLAALRDAGELQVLTSAAGLSRSVADAFELAGAPLLVTTADHALLDPPILEAFLAAAERAGGDIAVGLAAAATITASYPETRRTYLRFRDGGYSGANLFLLRTASAAAGIAFWVRIERDRKQPWRLARAFGPALLLAYLLRLCTLRQAMALASRRVGARAAAIAIPIAEAAIDVDKPADLDLVETILARRVSPA
jgi:GTP:adenosylcobinamide-phosphate guanylyltransferase